MKKIILITCVFGLNFNANASFFQTLQNNIKGILGINYKVSCGYKKDDQWSSITERVNFISKVKMLSDGFLKNVCRMNTLEYKKICERSIKNNFKNYEIKYTWKIKGSIGDKKIALLRGGYDGEFYKKFKVCKQDCGDVPIASVIEKYSVQSISLNFISAKLKLDGDISFDLSKNKSN